MRRLAGDTSAKAEEVQLAIWRSWTPQERIERACDLIEFVRRRVRSAIRERYPLISEPQARIQFLRRAYGDELADRVARHLGVSVDA